MASSVPPKKIWDSEFSIHCSREANLCPQKSHCIAGENKISLKEAEKNVGA
jgi:hypothetical protein